MSTVVIYQSSTGFTKQYAQWIAQELGVEALDIKKVNEGKVKQYDHVIFGGWIMGNMISGLDKMRKMSPAKITVFAVGSSEDSEKLENAIREQNHLDDTPFFYMEGGFHFDEIKFPFKAMLKMMKKSLEKKENKTPEEEYMAKTLGTSFDHSDRKFIMPLVEACKVMA